MPYDTFLLDSTSAIPESYLEQHENVHVVPLTISINQEYIPESDVTIEKVIECSERDKKPYRQVSRAPVIFFRLFQMYRKKILSSSCA